MKVTVNGEVFEFDTGRKPLSEALAVENALKIPYAQYEQGLQDGSAKSVAAFIWLVWRRNGKDVPLADILSGAVEVDLDGLEIQAEDGDGPGPTSRTPAVSSSTAAGTSARSRKSSTSAPGKSGS